jgi:hypothetical protein
MLNVYNFGYSCGLCTSYICNLINTDGCCWCCWTSCFNMGKCLHEMYVEICCTTTTCDYEYCLMYCSGCYDGYNNNTSEQSDNITMVTNTSDTNNNNNNHAIFIPENEIIL